MLILYFNISKNWNKGYDTEFSKIINFFSKKNKKILLLEPPYLSDRSNVFSMSKIIKMRKQRSKTSFFMITMRI